MEKKKAISLIVLVVTIIVMSILAATVIIALSNQNIIGEANKSVIRSELSSLQEKIAMYVVDNYTNIDASVKYNLDEFGIDKSDNMYKKYGSISYVYDGKLYITSSASETVQEIARELNMLSGELNSTEGEIKLKNASLTNLILYGNSVQDGTPTPDNPVEIQSVGEKTKNLFDITRFNFEDKTINGISYSFLDDNRVKIIGKITDNTKSASYSSNTISKTSAQKFNAGVYSVQRVYVDNKDIEFFVAAYDEEGNFITNIASNNVTVSEDFYVLRFGVYINPQINSNVNVTINLQLEEGSAATEYEPYGYKIPVTVSGKNLFDGNMQQGAYLVAEGDYTEVTNYICNKNPIYVDDTKNYYISRKDASEGYLQYILCYGENDTYLGYVSVSNKGSTFKPLENTKYINFDIVKASDKSNITTQEAGLIQIEEGTAATEYEPYQGSTTTNIYLDEPLRKVRDYADHIDFASGKVVRNVKEVVLTGTENWAKYASVDKHYQTTVKDNEFGKGVNNIMSNYYAPSKVIGNFYSNSDYAILSVDGSRIRIKDKDVSTVEEIKSKLAGYNDGGNPLRVIYHLKTQTEQSINLPSITSVKGTCIIKVEASVKPSMKVEYK